jgi:hypothetical protein
MGTTGKKHEIRLPSASIPQRLENSARRLDPQNARALPGFHPAASGAEINALLRGFATDLIKNGLKIGPKGKPLVTGTSDGKEITEDDTKSRKDHEKTRQKGQKKAYSRILGGFAICLHTRC